MTNLLAGGDRARRGPITQVDGCEVVTAGGSRLIDLSGLGHVLVVGHELEYVRDRIRSSISEPFLPGSGRLVHFEAAERLAAFLVEESRLHEDTKMYLAPSGTDAVELAVQIVAAAQEARFGSDPRRDIVLGMADSYHGMSLSAVDIGGHSSHRNRLRNLIHPWPSLPSWTALDKTAVLEDLPLGPLFERAVALLLEPIGGTTSGAYRPSASSVDHIFGLARQYRVPVVIDETMTGLGRAWPHLWTHAPLGGVVIASKWLAGGFVPASALFVSPNITEALEGSEVPLRFTFANLDLVARVASCVQGAVDDLDLRSAQQRNGLRLRAAVSSELSSFAERIEVRGDGLLNALELRVASAQDALAMLKEIALSRGIVAMFGSRRISVGDHRVHIMLTPPADLTEKDTALISAACLELVSTLERRGLFSETIAQNDDRPPGELADE